MPSIPPGPKIPTIELTTESDLNPFSETITMALPVKRVPEGLHTVTPHLTVRDGAKLIEFYKQAFGAKEVRRSVAPDGKSLLHADLQIGDSRIFLNDEFPEMGVALAPGQQLHARADPPLC